MLNPFPELLFLQAFAPLFIRVTVGVFFLIFSWNKIKKHNPQSAAHIFESIGLKPGNTYNIALVCLQAIIGAFMILGFLTQITAAVAVLCLLVAFIIKLRHKDKISTPVSIYVLLFIMSFSLILTGAGIPAIDLPL